MRTGSAAAVLGAAVLLGSLAGAYVLPAGGWSDRPSTPVAPASGPSSAAASPTSPAPPSPTAAPSDPDETPPSSSSPSAAPPSRPSRSDLLSEQSFSDIGVPATSNPSLSTTDAAADATRCVDDDVHTVRTLKSVTGHDPQLAGYWEQDDNGDVTSQTVASAADPAGAERSTAALVTSAELCQEAKPGHWVLGTATTENYSSTRSATWFGYYPDAQNTDGTAPAGVEPCGGTIVARNGSRFTVVNAYMCLESKQLGQLAAAASERLG